MRGLPGRFENHWHLGTGLGRFLEDPVHSKDRLSLAILSGNAGGRCGAGRGGGRPLSKLCQGLLFSAPALYVLVDWILNEPTHKYLPKASERKSYQRQMSKNL